MRVETPSGLIGEVRKLKGAEINILSDRQAIRKGTVVGDVLSACWIKTEDLGPYSELDWDKVLVCDRFFALVCVRMATYGSEFVFKTRCGESGRGGCGAQFEWEIDLKRDLPYFDLPEESREKIKSGQNLFETELETDEGILPVHFKLATGADEVKNARLAAKQKNNTKNMAITTAIAQRILKLGDATNKRMIATKLDNVDFDAQLEMLASMDEVDGGFDTKIEIECPSCGNVYEINLPFEGGTFWTPPKSSRKSASPSKKSRRIAKTMAERD